MIDIYVAGSNDGTIQCVGSSFAVYKDDKRILLKSWVTFAKKSEYTTDLGELLAFVVSLKFSLTMKYDIVRIHSGLDWVVNIINKHKTTTKRASKIVCELFKVIDDCKSIELSAIFVPEKKRKISERFNMCKKDSERKLEEKADSIEIDSDIVLYTDGAYNPKTRYYGAGVVVYSNEEHQIIDTISFKDNKYSESKSVAGSLLAATNAIEWCIDRKIYDKVTIVAPNLGVAMWANDIWLAKEKMTKEYKATIEKYRELVDFTFRHKYRGSLDINTNKATELAENACGFIKHP